MVAKLCQAALAVIAASGCGLPDGEWFGRIPEPDPEHLVWCNSGEPEYLDPSLASSTTDIKPIYAMFDGLADYSLDGLPEPSAATHWDMSEDLRTFTFHLRDGLRWSDEKPLTAHDFAYSLVRTLHPLTGSRNAETLWRLKNGEKYTANRVRMVMADVAGLSKGEVVEIVGLVGDEKAKDMPDSNLRKSTRRLALRDLGAPESDAYAKVSPGEELTIIELGSPAQHPAAVGTERAAEQWAYVFFAEDDGVYGWVPLAELDREPNAEVEYRVVPVAAEHRLDTARSEPPAAKETRVKGKHLLMLPETLGVRAIDDKTLVLETWGPVPYMLSLVVQSEFRATPRWAVSRRPKRWTLPGNIVTSGAYHMVVWRIRDRIEMIKSTTYWDADKVSIDKLTMFSLNDQAANANLYIQGSCDALTSNNIPSSYMPFLTKTDEQGKRKYNDFTVAPYNGIYFYLINVDEVPNVHFRRALNYALDRSQIPYITRGGEIPTAQYTPGAPIKELSDEELELCGVTRDTPGVAMIVEKDSLCYVPPQGLDYDPEKARAELALAKEQMGNEFSNSFSLKYNSGVEYHKLLAEWVQGEWKKELGLDVSLQSQEWKTFLKDTANGQYQVARMGSIGNFPDPEAEFLPSYKCSTPDNRTNWCSEEFDALMAKAEASSDRKERLEYARQAEKVMIEEAPIIPFFVYTQRHLQKPYVRDLAINLVDKFPFKKVWIDPDWKKTWNQRQAEASAP